jgi:hypothetical protein
MFLIRGLSIWRDRLSINPHVLASFPLASFPTFLQYVVAYIHIPHTPFPMLLAFAFARTRLTKPRPSTEADRVVARSGVRVLGRDEVYGAYKGVSETVPPGGGGALVAAAALHTLPRAFMLSRPIFWWGKVYQFIMPRMRFLLCTRPCLNELPLASHWHQSARRGTTMHSAILVGGTGPTEPIDQLAYIKTGLPAWAPKSTPFNNARKLCFE